MRRPLLDLSSLKDTILMPPPMLPSKSLQSMTSSEDYQQQQRPLIYEHFNTTSSDNTIITTTSHHSTSKHHFLQRKRSSFQDTAITEYSDDEAAKNEYSLQRRCLHKNKFKKLPIPCANKQIDSFVMNMVEYLTYFDNAVKTAMILKGKILTRYEDYQQNGLEKNYFLVSLSSMQNELIAMVCQEDDSLVIDEC